MMLWDYSTLQFRQELFSRRPGAATDPREAAGLDFARPVDDAASPTRSRSRSASARRSRTDRASTSGLRRVVIIGYAIPSFLFAILLIVLFAGGSFWQIFPLRGLTSENFAQLSLVDKVLDYLWHITLPVIAMALGRFRDLDASHQEFVSRRDQKAIRADRTDEGPEPSAGCSMATFSAMRC